MKAGSGGKRKTLLPGLLLKGGLLCFSCLFLLLLIGLGHQWSRQQLPPKQPIAFPHTVHAGELALPCTFCHRYAERARSAGVPALDRCMACHRSIAVDRPEVRKLAGRFERGQPVAWNRVHSLPSFIYFSHKRHLMAGLTCFACHGAVEKMAVVRKVRPLHMGWCVTCHRARNASRDCATCHR